MMLDLSLLEMFLRQPNAEGYGLRGGGPIRRGRRSSLGRRWRNRETVPPPPAKAARIEAGRAKLVAKAKRSAERSRRDREGSR